MTFTAYTLSRRSLLQSIVLTGTTVLALAACSPDAGPKPVAGSIKQADSYEVLAKEGKGFAVGALMSANTVYVLFDPQCPHCGHLWEQSLPLHKKVILILVRLPTRNWNYKNMNNVSELIMVIRIKI